MKTLDWATYFRRLADFILAQISNAPNIAEIAGEVICLHEGSFKTINQLLSECTNHKWNSLIYEAWVWETADRIESLMLKLDGPYIEALLIAGGSEYLKDASIKDAYGAIREAQLHLQEGG